MSFSSNVGYVAIPKTTRVPVSRARCIAALAFSSVRWRRRAWMTERTWWCSSAAASASNAKSTHEELAMRNPDGGR